MSRLGILDTIFAQGDENLRRMRAAEAEAMAEARRDHPLALGNEAGGFITGVTGAAARLAGPAVRAAEAVGIAPAGSADDLVRRSNAMNEAQRRNVDDAGMSGPRQWVNQQIPGVTSSLSQAAVLGMTGGTAALTAGFGLGEANEALTEAKDAGLVGDQAVRYAATQGALESGIMLVGQGLGKAVPALAGLEGVFTQQQVPQKLTRELVKQMGVRTAAELTEEELTAILQTINRAASLPGAENAANWTDENGDVLNSPMMRVIRETAGRTFFTMGLMESPRLAGAALESRRERADRVSQAEDSIRAPLEGELARNETAATPEQPAGNLRATSEQPATGLLADLIAQSDPANAGADAGAAGPTPVDNLIERQRAADEAAVRDRLRRMLLEPEIAPESPPPASSQPQADIASPEPQRPAESEFERLGDDQRNELLREFSSLDDADLEQQVDALIQQAPQFAEEIELLGRESRDIRAETDRVSQEEPLIAEFGRRRLGKRPDRVDVSPASPDAGNVSPELQNVDTSAEVPTNRNTGEQSSAVYDFLNDPAVTERLRRIVVAQGHSVHDAEDIVQSVLSSVWDKEDESPGYFQPETLENYVTRAVTNRSRGQTRTIGRRREQQVDAPDVADPSIEGLPPDVIAASREASPESSDQSPVTADEVAKSPEIQLALQEVQAKVDTGKFRPTGSPESPSDWQSVLDAIGKAARQTGRPFDAMQILGDLQANLSEAPNSSPEPSDSLQSEPPQPREGDTRVDEFGVTQVYRLIDPNSVSFTESTSDVENHPSVEEYARLAREGSVPPPIEVVFNEDSSQPVTVNRRRVMAAQRAGTTVPAWVDKKSDDILQPKKKLGKKQADPAPVSPETVPEPSAQAAPAETPDSLPGGPTSAAPETGSMPGGSLGETDTVPAEEQRAEPPQTQPEPQTVLKPQEIAETISRDISGTAWHRDVESAGKALTPKQLKSELETGFSGGRRDLFNGLAKKYGIYTDSRLAMKLPEKERAAYTTGDDTPQVESAYDMVRGYLGQETSATPAVPVATRGGVILLRNADGDQNFVDPKFYQTVLKRYPNARAFLSKADPEGAPVVMKDESDPVAVIMPLQVDEIPKDTEIVDRPVPLEEHLVPNQFEDKDIEFSQGKSGRNRTLVTTESKRRLGQKPLGIPRLQAEEQSGTWTIYDGGKHTGDKQATKSKRRVLGIVEGMREAKQAMKRIVRHAHGVDNKGYLQFKPRGTDQFVDGNKLVTPEPQGNTGDVTEQRSAIGQKTGAAADAATADAATAEFKAALKEVGRQIGKAARGETPGMGGAFSDEMFNAVVAAVKAGVKAGVTNFADLVVRAAEELGEATVRNAGRLFEMSWEIVGETNNSLDKPGSVAEILDTAMPESSPALPENADAMPENGPAMPESDAALPENADAPPAGNSDSLSPDEPDDSLTSIKKAFVDAERAVRGDSPLLNAPQQTKEQWADEAEARMRANPMYASDLVVRLNREVFPPDPVEVIALQLYKMQLKQRRTAARQKLTESRGDDLAEVQAQTELDSIVSLYRDHEAATSAVGALQSRAFMARRFFVTDDYDVVDMTDEAIGAAGGRELTDAEQQRVNEASEELQRLKDENDELRRQIEDRAQAEEIDERIAEDVKAVGGKRTTRSRSQKKVDAALKEFRSIWAEVSGEGNILGRLLSEEAGSVDVDRIKRLTAAAGKVVSAYAELGVSTFGEMMARVRAEMGAEAEQIKDVFQNEWKKAVDAGQVVQIALDPSDPNDARALTQLARQIQRALVENGLRERDPIVDGVMSALREIFPDLTRRQVMDMLSGYGQFTPVTENEVDLVLLDVNAQLRLMSQKEDIDSGKPPRHTGKQRPDPSDEQRELQRMVNEAKRQRPDLFARDDKARLRGAIEAAERAAAHRLRDMQKELASGQKMVRGRGEPLSSPQLDKIRKQIADLMPSYKAMFPPRPMSDESRLNAAIRNNERMIGLLEEQIKSGDVAPKKRLGMKLTSPKLEATQARLMELRAIRAELRAQQNPKMSAEERAALSYIRSLEKRRADYLEMIERGDVETKKRQPRTLTDAEKAKKKEFEEAKQKWKDFVQEKHRENRNIPERLYDMAAGTVLIQRAIKTAIDASVLGVQLGGYMFGHPVLFAKTAIEGLSRSRTDADLKRFMEELQSHPLYERAVKAGLDFTDPHGPLSKQEEGFMGRLVEKIPGVAISSRLFHVYSNMARMELFSAKVAALARRDGATDAELRIIGRFINIATGRGDLGQYKAAAETLAIAMFSPKYFASRLQYLWEPFRAAGLRRRSTEGYTTQVKRELAKEYGRHIAGVSAFYLANALYAMLADDDEFKIELDPRSSDFGKIRHGDTRIDPLSGLSQVVVFGSRLAAMAARIPNYKTRSGRVIDILDKSQRGSLEPQDILFDFARSKMAPAIGSGIDFFTGENFVGDPRSRIGVLAEAFMPISVVNAYESIDTFGWAKGGARAVLAAMAFNVNTYGDETDYLQAVDDDPKPGIVQKVKRELATVFRGVPPETKQEIVEKWLRRVDYTPESITSAVKALPDAEQQRFEQTRTRKLGKMVQDTVISAGIPEPQQGETADEYGDRLAKRQAKLAEQQQWIEQHADDPGVQDAIRQAVRSRSYRDLMDREFKGERNTLTRPKRLGKTADIYNLQVEAYNERRRIAEKLKDSLK